LAIGGRGSKIRIRSEKENSLRQRKRKKDFSPNGKALYEKKGARKRKEGSSFARGEKHRLPAYRKGDERFAPESTKKKSRGAPARAGNSKKAPLQRVRRGGGEGDKKREESPRSQAKGEKECRGSSARKEGRHFLSKGEGQDSPMCLGEGEKSLGKEFVLGADPDDLKGGGKGGKGVERERGGEKECCRNLRGRLLD